MTNSLAGGRGKYIECVGCDYKLNSPTEGGRGKGVNIFGLVGHSSPPLEGGGGGKYIGLV